MALSRKTIFATLLIVLGVGFGLMVVLTYSMSGGSTGITLTFLAAAVVCVLVGTVLAFSRLLDRFVNPVIEELHADIADDLLDIKERRMTNTIWMAIITGLAALVYFFFILRFHKVEAVWGSIPVIVPTVIGMGLLVYFIPRTSWFQTAGYTPFWIFLIPTIGLLVTLWVGVSRTENIELLTLSRAQSVDYNLVRPVSFMFFNSVDTGGLDLSLPSCDDEGCAVLLVIGLIILVFVLVIGSAMIPHFWLLSGSMMLCIMALITIHDLRIRQVTKAPS
jgi:hypothetical protein